MNRPYLNWPSYEDLSHPQPSLFKAEQQRRQSDHQYCSNGNSNDSGDSRPESRETNQDKSWLVR